MIYAPEIFIQNVYFLAKQQNKRIGEIESRANLSAGYLSRMKKENRSTAPSIDMVASIATILGVSIDALISIDFTKLSPTDLFISMFIERLYLNSGEDRVEWKNHSEEDILSILDTDHTELAYLFEKMFEPAAGSLRYYSSFDLDDHKNIGRVFSAITGKATTFLISYEESKRLFVDLYFATEGNNGFELIPLASSTSEPLAEILDGLYDLVKRSTRVINLNENIINTMTDYINGIT